MFNCDGIMYAMNCMIHTTCLLLCLGGSELIRRITFKDKKKSNCYFQYFQYKFIKFKKTRNATKIKLSKTERFSIKNLI